MSKDPGTHSNGKLTNDVYVPCGDFYVKPSVVKKNACRGSSSKNRGGEVSRKLGNGRENVKGKGGKGGPPHTSPSPNH